MAASILGITLHLRMAPGESCVLRDQATGTAISSGNGDGTTGLLDLPMSWQQFLQAMASGQAGAVAATDTVAPVAGAGGSAGAGGTLTQELPIAGEADAAGGGSSVAPSQAVPAEAGGAAGASGTLSGTGGPSAMEGSAAGQGGASATPTVSVPLGGSAGGSAGAGPSTQAQDGPHLVGEADGAATGAATPTVQSPLAGSAAGAATGGGTPSVSAAGCDVASYGAVASAFATSITPDLPGSISAGQLLVAIVAGSAAPTNIPTGWKPRSVSAYGATFFRVATGDAGDVAPAFSFSISHQEKAVCLAVSNANTAPSGSYTTGTVGSGSGQPNVTGTGTSWTEANGVTPGGTFTAGGNSYTIKTVNSPVSITLTTNLLGSLVASTYSISPTPIERASVVSNDLGPPLTVSQITTITNGALLVLGYMLNDVNDYGDEQATIGTPSGPATTLITKSDGAFDPPSGLSIGFGVWKGTKTTAGATGNATCNGTVVSDLQEQFGVLLAVTPS